MPRVLLAVAVAAVLATGGHPATAAPALSPNTSHAAYAEPPECPYQGPHTVIGRGATGPAVVHLQCLLNRIWGYDVPVDGTAGPSTRAAVVSHQADCHLPVDGVVGPQTWLALHPDTTTPECLDEGRS